MAKVEDGILNRSFLDELAIHSRGKPLKPNELVALNTMNDAVFDRRLAELRQIGELPSGYGLKVQPLRLLLQNERDFFIGAIALGNVTVERVDWGGNKHKHNYHTVVSTESKRPLRRAMLKGTIGLWAEDPSQRIENPRRLRLYLPHEKFRYLIRREENLTDEVVNDVNRFGPMILGFTTNGLRGEENRIPYPDYAVLSKIYDSWEEHFGFDMGGFQRRTYPDSDTVSGVIIVRDWNEVIGTMMEVESVGGRKKGLKFLPALQERYKPGG